MKLAVGQRDGYYGVVGLVLILGGGGSGPGAGGVWGPAGARAGRKNLKPQDEMQIRPSES